MAQSEVMVLFKGKDVSLSKVAGGIGGAFGNLGKVVAGGIGVGITALAGLGIASGKAAMTMESQMSDIAAILNTTVEEITPLGDLIQELGLNPNLKVDATEAASAIQMLARNGLSMEEILEGAAESTVLLANATGSDFGNAANIATDAMAIFNIEAKDMNTAVDGIVSVTTNSKFTIDDFSLALAQGGGVASAAGVSFNDFNTTISAISPLFASGSDAGTALKTMLTRLIPGSNAAKDAMFELGLIALDTERTIELLKNNGIEPLSDSSSDLKLGLEQLSKQMGMNATADELIESFDLMGNQFFDTQGNMKDMADIAGVLQDAFIGLSEEQKTAALQTIFGSDSMRAAVALAETGKDAFLGLAESMGETDAAANAAVRMDNVAGVMEILEGIVDSVVLSIGKGLLPVLRGFADQALILAEKVMPFVEEGIRIFSEIMKNLFNNLSEGMTPLDAFIEAIWDFVPQEILDRLVEFRDNILPGLIIKITEIKDKIIAFMEPIIAWIQQNIQLKDVLIGLGIVLGGIVLGAIISVATAIGPIILAAGALIGIVALLREAWATNWGDIQGKTQAFITFWNEILWPGLQQVWAWMSDVLWPFLRDVIGPLFGQVLTEKIAILKYYFTEILLPGIRDLWTFLTVSLMPVWEALGEFVGVALPFALSVTRDYIQNILMPTFDNIYKVIKDSLGPIFEWLKVQVIDKLNKSIMTTVFQFERLIEWVRKAKSTLESFSLPDILMPGSPTPFELGLMGINKQMSLLANTNIPQFNNAMQSTGNTTVNAQKTINQNFTINTSSIDTNSESRAALQFATGGI